MELSEARYQAELVVSKLAPWCEKVIICGSIRRLKREVTDIDICLMPHKLEIKDMFGAISGTVPVLEFVDVVNSWEKVKGEATGKYTQRLLPDGHKLELSICDDINRWGALTLIRTGDAEFSHMMMKAVLKRGLEQRDGFLWKDNYIIPIKDERQYFEVLHLPFIKPEYRDANAYKHQRL